MRSPTLALAWQHWGRHRWGLAVVLLFLAIVAGLFQGMPGGVTPLSAFLCSVQFVLVLIYVTAVFSYGFESKLELRESGFPTRLFVLPVRTVQLVGWPMLQGVAVVTVLWA